MRATEIIGVVLFAVLLFGCSEKHEAVRQPVATPPAPLSQYDRLYQGFGRISKGMSKDEVRTILGNPTKEGKHGQWVWTFDKTVSPADKEIYYIHFTNDVVAEMNHIRSYFDKNQKNDAEPKSGHVRK